MLPINEFRWFAVFYPWWGLGDSLLPLFTSWCVSWPLSSTKKIANLQAIFGITKNCPIPKKWKGNKDNQFATIFPPQKNGGGTHFSKKFPMKTNNFLFALLRFQAWKALNEASESGDSVLQGMTQVLWRGSAEVLEQTDLPKSLRSLKLGRNYNTPKTPKSLIWHTKIDRMDQKGFQVEMLRRLLLDDLRGIWADNDQKRPPKRWLWWFRFAVSIGD